MSEREGPAPDACPECGTGCIPGTDRCAWCGSQLREVRRPSAPPETFEERLRNARVRALIDSAEWLEIDDEAEARREGREIELAAAVQIAECLRHLARQIRESKPPPYSWTWPTIGSPAEALAFLERTFPTRRGQHVD